MTNKSTFYPHDKSFVINTANRKINYAVKITKKLFFNDRKVLGTYLLLQWSLCKERKKQLFILFITR